MSASDQIKGQRMCCLKFSEPRYAYPIPFGDVAKRPRNLCDSKGRIEKQGRKWCSDSEEGHFVSDSLQVAGGESEETMHGAQLYRFDRIIGAPCVVLL